ncbi:MAG: ankyrin repeat domain-containing protein [Fusobacterium periodonticum]|nr:ankyrin repeat domain-containing protein [Fusobacterium periodonticum]
MMINNCSIHIKQEELDEVLNSHLFIPIIKKMVSTIYRELSVEKIFDIDEIDENKKVKIFKSKLREIIGEKSIYVLENKNEGIYKFISNLEKKEDQSSKFDTVLSFIKKLDLSEANENEVFLFLTLFSIERNLFKKFDIKDKVDEVQGYDIDTLIKTIENKEKSEEYLKEEELINEMKNVVGNLNSENYEESKEKIEKIYKKDTSSLLQYFKDYYYGRFLARSGEEEKGLDKYFDSLKEAKYRAGNFLENILIEGMILAFRIDSKKYKKFYNYSRFMGIVTKEYEGDNDWINKHYFQYFDRYFSPIFKKDENVSANDYIVLSTGEKLVEDKALSIKDLRTPDKEYEFGIRKETRLSIFSRLPVNIKNGYTEEYIQLCMLKLLEAKANINFINSTGETALMGAIAYKNYERAKLLLKYPKVKETINQKSLRKKNTVISLIIEQFVVFGGFLPFEMKELLLELFIEILKYEPNLNQITTVNDVTYIRQIMQVFSQRENFYKNAYNNNDAWRREYQDSFNTMFTDEKVIDFIRKQEKMVNDPNFIKIMNKIFLDNRIYYLKLLDLLLKAGADINIKQQFGISDLMFATELGDLELFKLLAKYNPNIETMTDKGKNLFTNAMDYGNYDLAFYLLKEYPYFRKNIDYCSRDIQEPSKVSSLLGKFLEKHDIEKIKEMIEMGANINSKTAMKGITALIIAIETEDEDFIKFVLKKGADVNIKIENKYLEIPGYIEFLEKYGDFVDTANNGITPLMKACIIENLEIIKLLIEKYGAEINAQNDIQRWTALDFAMVTKNTKVIEYLKSKGAISGIKK